MTRRRQALIEEHLNLVYSLAVKVYRTIRGAIELDDLVAFGTVGLLQAADRYDPERGSRFATFAYARIHGAIYDGVRDSAPLPATIYRRLCCQRGDDAQDRSRVIPFVTSLEGYLEKGHQVTDQTHDAEVTTLRHEVSSVVDTALDQLPERERSLIRAHYFQDKTLKRAGGELGISKSWACRVHAHALDHLRAATEVMALAA